MKHIIHKVFCDTNTPLSRACCKHMAGFLNCSKHSYSDGNGVVVPEKGIVVMTNDIEKERIRNDLAPQWIRFVVTANSNHSDAKKWIKIFRQQGIRILLCLQDKYNASNVSNLAFEYAKEFKSDICYECNNEPNSNIAPKSEHWNNYISPAEYIRILENFKNAVKKNDVNALVSIGGLNGMVKQYNENKEMPSKDYIKEIVKLGGLKLFDYWNIHFYEMGASFYQSLEVMNKVAKEKPIIIGEMPARNMNEYSFWMEKLTKNYIKIAIVYAWRGGKEWEIYNKPEMLHYIKKY